MAAERVDIDGQIAVIASSLNGRSAQLADDLLARVLTQVPELRDDEAVRELLVASIRANVTTGIDVVGNAIDVAGMEPPAAAAEYARRIAQRGVPLEALLRAYRVGHHTFLDGWLAELGRRDLPAAELHGVLDVVTRASFDYIDRISEQLIGVYVGERERWLQSASASRAALVRRLLSGEDGNLEPVEAALHYGLRRWHLGLVTWLVPGFERDGPRALDRASAALVASLPLPPLSVMADEATLWSWLPVEELTSVERHAIANAVAAGGGIRMAFGSPGLGVAGFRATHEQALRAQAVGVAAGASGAAVTSFQDASLISFLTADLRAAQGWVADVLGPLAQDTEPAGHLRETLSVFLETKGSYKQTAERLHLHKNSVLYRIRKTEALRGRPLDDDRVGVEVALLACKQLGATVLSA